MKANKDEVIQLLKTAKGQMDGIIKMVEEDRYCIDVSNQLLAAQSILKNANRKIIKAHMSHCVKEALLNEQPDAKIDEILKLIDKMSK